MYLSAKLRALNRKGYTIKSWILLAPITGATLVCVSRTMDYRHHATDVIAGGIVGVLTAWWGYRQYFPVSPALPMLYQADIAGRRRAQVVEDVRPAREEPGLVDPDARCARRDAPPRHERLGYGSREHADELPVASWRCLPPAAHEHAVLAHQRDIGPAGPGQAVHEPDRILAASRVEFGRGALVTRHGRDGRSRGLRFGLRLGVFLWRAQRRSPPRRRGRSLICSFSPNVTYKPAIDMPCILSYRLRCRPRKRC